MVLSLLVLLWAGVIFWFSAQSGDDSSAASGRIVRQVIRLLLPGFETIPEAEQETILGTVTLIVRKGAHFSEYLILGSLLWGLIRTCTDRWKRLLGISWTVGTLYAVSDELHQMFSSGRSPKAADVCIDSAGVMAGILLCFLVFAYVRRRKRSRRAEN